MTKAPMTASEVATRMQDLFGHPLPDLRAAADASEHDSLLAALLDVHDALGLSERAITWQLERMRQLTATEAGPLEQPDARKLLDCARRLSEAIAVRDAQAHTVSAVLANLRRAAPSPPTTAPAQPPPAPPSLSPTAAAPARAR